MNTNDSTPFRYLSKAIEGNGGCSSFKYNHLPVVADRHSLRIIKYSNRGYYGQIRPLVTHSQSQDVPQFFYTDTANTFLGTLQVHLFLKLIQEVPTLTFEQNGEILVLDVR